MSAEASDVNHPSHYTSHPSGVECIAVTEHMGFNLGNAVKYIWRVDGENPKHNDGGLKDLQKAAWYIQREIARRQMPNTEVSTEKTKSLGWISNNRCGRRIDSEPDRLGEQPHEAHGFGFNGSYWCDGYV